MKSKGLPVKLQAPEASAFKKVWEEKLRGTSYTKSAFGRTRCLKMVYCLHEACMADWRKKASKALTGCIMQDSQNALFAVRCMTVHSTGRLWAAKSRQLELVTQKASAVIAHLRRTGDMQWPTWNALELWQ